MRKIGVYIIIFLLVILLRNNISYFYGNILGVFKLDNKYYEGIINLKDEEIKYLKNEYKNYDKFTKNLSLIDYDYKVSKILYKESYNTDKYKIQYGKDNNIKKGMAVTNEYGLVGKITSVDKNSSIFTILKELEDISIVINDVYGKLNYNYDVESFIVSDISNYDKVHINDKVYTSGYGTIKEKLYIGKVSKIENNNISKKIFVKSEVNFNNLNYVLIVGDFNDINS